MSEQSDKHIDIKSENGHYVAYVNGKAWCTSDTYLECVRELTFEESNIKERKNVMLNMPVYHFSYEGPVRSFDRIRSSRWKGETYATSEEKARSNLIHQYKMEHGLEVFTRISLVNEIKMIGKL